MFDVGERRVPAHRADRVDRVEDGGVARCLGEGGVPGRQFLTVDHPPPDLSFSAPQVGLDRRVAPAVPPLVVVLRVAREQHAGRCAPSSLR